MFLIRHGQSVFNQHFNATGRDPLVRDAPLTPRGVDEAQGAARYLKDKSITRVITSPYSRALQTGWEIAQLLGLSMVANPLVGERRLYSCDIGTPTSTLKQQWPQVDFSALDNEQWWPHAEETQEDIEKRVEAFLSQSDAETATTLVVSHWYFIFTLSGQDCENAQTVWRDPHGRFHKQG